MARQKQPVTEQPDTGNPIVVSSEPLLEGDLPTTRLPHPDTVALATANGLLDRVLPALVRIRDGSLLNKFVGDLRDQIHRLIPEINDHRKG